MKIRNFILTQIFLLFSLACMGIPARKGELTLRQPDGSTFRALMAGDEFTRIKTTAAGNAIIQSPDGWWCYAVYDTDGNKTSSGWKVGHDVPHEIIESSRRIPYSILSEKARESRAAMPFTEEESVIRKLRRQYSATKSEDETVTKHGLVILAEFSDVQFKFKKDDFTRLLTEEGYSLNGATGCAKEYFDDQFGGTVRFDFQVSDIITLPRTRAYYGANDNSGNDKAPAEMIRDACKLADENIDFSLYDDDGDGNVDNVFLFFAGPDEAEGAAEECIWSHAWYIYSSTARLDLTCDGKRIDRYACSSELSLTYDKEGNVSTNISTIGTFCHEYSHTFGLPDFYDTDYESSGGISAGFWGQTSLMDSGNYNNLGNTPPYFNALERMLLGLQEPVVLEETGNYTLAPIHKGGPSYILKTDTDDEYFLFECRAREGWDEYIGGNGMLVYHIDASDGGYTVWNHLNEVNIDPSHQKADLMEADGRADAFTTVQEYAQGRQNLSGIFFPFHDVTSLSKDTTPGLVSWDGTKSTWSITAIRRDGENINFNLLGETGVEPPVVKSLTSEIFADAAIIRFESSFIYEGKASVSWGRPGREMTELEVGPYSPGRYAVILEDLESSGTTYEVEIYFTADDIEGERTKSYVMTKRTPPVKWPYITFGSSERNSDGSFSSGRRIPLHVNNAADAAEITWTFDGKTITHEGDGFHTLTKSGELKAVVQWEDGSSDIIIKNIQISE